MSCCESLRVCMAKWLSTIKETITNTVFGSDKLKDSEMENVSSDTNPTTPPSILSLEESMEGSPSSPLVHSAVREDDSYEHDSTPLSPSSVNDTAIDDSLMKVQHKVQWKSCANIPIETKSAQGVLMDNELYMGGGYVSDSKLSSVVHKYNTVFDFWDPLPPCPVKRFGMTTFDGGLVLIGGKERGNFSTECTNRITSWDESDQTWKFILPSMTYARMSPVVFSHGRYLIVAGGKKGSLDYNMEIYDSGTKRWVTAPPLPAKCFPHSSTVRGDEWFLVQEEKVFQADIPSLIQHATGKFDAQTVTDLPISTESVPDLSSHDYTNLWQLLPRPPVKPDLITIVCGRLLAVSRGTNSFSVHTHIYDEESMEWCYASKLPNMCSTSSTAADGQGGVFLFGGDGSLNQYSNKLYRVTVETAASSQKTATKRPSLSFQINNY